MTLFARKLFQFLTSTTFFCLCNGIHPSQFSNKTNKKYFKNIQIVFFFILYFFFITVLSFFLSIVWGNWFQCQLLLLSYYYCRVAKKVFYNQIFRFPGCFNIIPSEQLCTILCILKALKTIKITIIIYSDANLMRRRHTFRFQTKFHSRIHSLN